jgi:shikimate kinase/3-dehydroquinate synthase
VSAPARSVVVVGFMGAGKTTAARAIAERPGHQAVDIDDEIVARTGRSIGEIFATDGEAAFRRLEEELTLQLLGVPGSVLSLGGGALGSAVIREALTDHLVVWIDVDVETAWRRCAHSGRPLARDRATFPQRRAHDMQTVLGAVDGLGLPGVRMLWASSPSGDYPAYIGPGLLGSAEGEGEGDNAPVAAFWPAAITGRRFLVTDWNAGRRYADRLPRLDGRVVITPGEQSKTVAHAEIVWTELTRGAMTRADIVVALGGGVIGDLAGFCAATYQRGVRFVQVPTTLVAQVDSAYGGKTGVDLPEAKNYVGAFHQPRAVIADTDTLATLPPEELGAGYAEVVKTALLAGGWLWERVRSGADPRDPDVIAACAHTKLRVVAADERDTGVRQTLNLGHTVGHAIETVTGYASYRHGEAVGLGLLAALRLSGAPDLREEVAGLLAARGLPTTLSDVDPDAVVMATARDKKRVGEGPVPFVLLADPGRARPGSSVSPRELIAAVRELATG